MSKPGAKEPAQRALDDWAVLPPRVVSAEGLALAPGDTSRFHFSREAQMEFGKRYEAAMVTALGW